MSTAPQLRIARPVSDLERAARLYCDGLELQVLYRFADHEGFSGIMVGLPGAAYHFEFTVCLQHPVAPAPTPEDLTVLYVPEESEWQLACARLESAGFRTVVAFNSYWEETGPYLRGL
jgi:catechol 2,3-dioxygenase-like lactoylglutathione lyase family enzyme